MPAGGDDSYDECLIHSGSDAIWGRFCFFISWTIQWGAASTVPSDTTFQTDDDSFLFC